MSQKYLILAICSLAALIACGCATVTTVGGESLEVGTPDFRAYVERVFREQNRVATELAFVLFEADLNAGSVERLEAADERLLAACAELNELAVRRRDDRRMGPVQAARAARRAPDCEAATLEAQAALDALAEPPGRSSR